MVTSTEAIAKKSGVLRQTPRVSIAVKRTGLAKQPLGRSELKRFTDWTSGRPEVELNFKFYRQATNKIVGISDEAAAFLEPGIRPLTVGSRAGELRATTVQGRLLVSQLRAKTTSKPAKDLRQAATLIEALVERFPGAVEDALTAVPRSAVRHVRRAAAALTRHLPASAEAAWEALKSYT